MDLLCDALDEEELLDKLAVLTPRFHYTHSGWYTPVTTSAPWRKTWKFGKQPMPPLKEVSVTMKPPMLMAREC